MNNNDTIIMMGSSGSGKGTQVKLLTDYIKTHQPTSKIFHFESGKHFREFITHEGYTSQIMKGILGKGILAPDFITEWLMVDSFVKNITDEPTIMILDGFPRTLNQARTLDSAMDYYQRNHIKVIHIKVPEEEIRRRMVERDRKDDQDIEVINRRITWYRENVIPTIGYLEQQNQYEVITIDGEQSIEDVHRDIIAGLNY